MAVFRVEKNSGYTVIYELKVEIKGETNGQNQKFYNQS